MVEWLCAPLGPVSPDTATRLISRRGNPGLCCEILGVACMHYCHDHCHKRNDDQNGINSLAYSPFHSPRHQKWLHYIGLPEPCRRHLHHSQQIQTTRPTYRLLVQAISRDLVRAVKQLASTPYRSINWPM